MSLLPSNKNILLPPPSSSAGVVAVPTSLLKEQVSDNPTMEESNRKNVIENIDQQKPSLPEAVDVPKVDNIPTSIIHSDATAINVYSEEDKANINRIAADATMQFMPDSETNLWTTKDDLATAIKSFSKANGFTVGLNGCGFFCSRAQESKSHQKRRLANSGNIPDSKKRKVNSHRCGCEFVIRYTSASPHVRDAPMGSVRVTSGSSWYHSNGCRPGADQLRCGNLTSGYYTKLVLNHANVKILYDLMHKTGQVVNAKIIRDILRSAVPEGVPITSLFICNLRNKIRLSVQKGDDGSGVQQAMLESLQHLCTSTSADTNEEGQLQSLEALPANFIDNASRHARTVLQQALKEPTDAARIFRLLQELHNLDEGFLFREIKDRKGNPSGYVWMTPWQRAAFEQFGDVIFLDCMKRKQNSVDWPYIGPVVLDGDNKIVVIAESICCTERLDAYEFVMNPAFDFTPNRPRNTVNVIYGDGIMSDNLLKNLGIFDSCKLCLDTYHLLNVDWPRKFGVRLFGSLRPILECLVYTKTETKYLEQYNKLRSMLASNPRLLKYLEQEIHANRQKFCRCYVLTYEGNLRRQGDSPAEANHSSYVRRIGPGSSEEPVIAIVQMLERMTDMATERNHQITGYHLRCLGESTSLKDETQAAALLSLSKIGLQLWNEQFEEAKQYEKVCIKDQPGLFEVQRKNSNARPRILGDARRCDCEHRVSMLAQCRHEICLFGFRLDFFAKRYHQRSSLEVSRTPVMKKSNVEQAMLKHNSESGCSDDDRPQVTNNNDTCTNDPLIGITIDDEHQNDDANEDDVSLPFNQDIDDTNQGNANNNDPVNCTFSIQGADLPIHDGSIPNGELTASLPSPADMLDTDTVLSVDAEIPVRRECETSKSGVATIASHNQTQGKRKRSQEDYRRFMTVTNELWDGLSFRDDVNDVCGLMLKLKHFMKTSEIDRSMTLDDWLNTHLSCFASYRSSGDLFAETTGTNLATNHHDPGQMMDATSVSLTARTPKTAGATRTTRLKPAVEKILKGGKKQKAMCSFCREVNHKSNNCQRIKDLDAKQVKDENLDLHLGDPKAHQVLTMPSALLSSNKNMDFEAAVVPFEAVHVVINAVYKNPEMSEMGRNAPKDPKEDLVDATFLGKSGRPIEGAPNFYKVKFVRRWISQKTARSMIFTKLLPPTSRITNDYVYPQQIKRSRVDHT